MIQVEFVPSGSDMNQAMVSTCELTSKIFLKKNTELNFKYLDIRCLSAEDAESLDELMWSIPQNALIPHKLVHNQNNNSQIDIGYPGIIFPVKEKKILINLNPNLPTKISSYSYMYQMVIEDGSHLREAAANTWKECKKLGIKTSFNKNI